MSSNDLQSQLAGQQSAPSSTVPHTPGLPTPAYTSTSGQTNNLAVVSLVAGGISFFAHVVPGSGLVVALVAIVTGFMARGQIRRTGEQGIWMANLGIIIGFVHLALGFIFLILLLIAIFVVGVTVWGISVHIGASPTPAPSG